MQTHETLYDFEFGPAIPEKLRSLWLERLFTDSGHILYKYFRVCLGQNGMTLKRKQIAIIQNKL